MKRKNIHLDDYLQKQIKRKKRKIIVLSWKDVKIGAFYSNGHFVPRFSNLIETDCSCAGCKSSQGGSFECGGKESNGELLLSSVYRTGANRGAMGVNCSKIRGTFASSKIFGKSCLYKKEKGEENCL